MDNNDRHILFIENYTGNLGKFFNYLVFRSYPVEMVDSISMALDYISNKKVSVIISQVMLLDSDITELVEKIKKMEDSIPLVMVLTDKLAERAVEALEIPRGYCIHNLENFKENEKLIARLHYDYPNTPIVESPGVEWKENYLIIIPSDPQYIERVIVYLLEKTKTYLTLQAQVNALRMSISEALANAIEHGNKYDSQKNVFINFEIDAHQLKISIQDEGEGFNIQNLKRNVEDLNQDFNIRGRGLLLIENYMDVVEFIPPGNKINMIKYINSKQS